MRYLLDTHTLLWAIYDSKRVSGIIDLLEDPSNEIFYSALNIWEVSIKHNIDKMEVGPEETIAFAKELGFLEIPVTAKHASKVLFLQRKTDKASHKDPFDMLLIAQAKEEGLTLLTRDKKISREYNEPCIMHF